MTNLTLKGIPGPLHERLRAVAEDNRRSLNGEAIHRLERSFDDDARAAWAVQERVGPLREPEPEVITLAEFIALPDGDPYRLELAAGRVVREPAPGFRHGRVASRLSRILWEAAGQGGHGEVFFDMGFLLVRDPPTVRIPDVAFVSATRLAEHATEEVFLGTAPDLAVEVLSPSNSASEIQRKAFEYLDAGALLVWIVDPAAETVTVYRARNDIRVLGAGETLDGTTVLPGLEVEVGGLFL
jgi:Uma2 family endonuclease